MPDTDALVINTSPMLALIAASGDLRLLQMYSQVYVPFEVCQEILSGGTSGFGVAEFQAAYWLKKQNAFVELLPYLNNSLDRGEAAVIQSALQLGVRTVCIDEAVGRRVARLCGLNVTGSIAVLLRAWREGTPFSMRDAIRRMQQHGIRLSARVIDFALTQTGEHEGKA